MPNRRPLRLVVYARIQKGLPGTLRLGEQMLRTNTSQGNGGNDSNLYKNYALSRKCQMGQRPMTQQREADMAKKNQDGQVRSRNTTSRQKSLDRHAQALALAPFPCTRLGMWRLLPVLFLGLPAASPCSLFPSCVASFLCFHHPSNCWLACSPDSLAQASRAEQSARCFGDMPVWLLPLGEAQVQVLAFLPCTQLCRTYLAVGRLANRPDQRREPPSGQPESPLPLAVITSKRDLPSREAFGGLGRCASSPGTVPPSFLSLHSQAKHRLQSDRAPKKVHR